MRRPVFLLLAVATLALAGGGLWLGGMRDEVRINAAFAHLPRLSDMPFFRCADSFYWVSYAREMVETGEFRVRRTRMDNAPYGRPNAGWSSLNAWYLVALGKSWSGCTGLPVAKALPLAALWSGPILYLLALAAILLLGGLTAQPAAATGAALVLATSPRVYDDFAFAVPGHHGWHDLACFGTLLALAAGLRGKNSRAWFAGAGFCAAVAIWIGATQQAFGIAAMGLGVLAGWTWSRFGGREGRDGDKLPPAECWRAFGISAGLGALLFYFLEYGGGPFAMRLEVNHPIYAFGLLLGGEFLCRAQRLLAGTKRTRRDLLVAAVSAILLGGIAAAVVFGPAEWHTMRQPFMQRLHHEIAEFQPITLSAPIGWMLILGAPIFFVAAACWRAFGRPMAARERVALLACAFPCAVAIALSFVQLRWAGIAGASAAALAAVVFSGTVRPTTASSRWPFPALPTTCLGLSLLLIAAWSWPRLSSDPAQLRAQIVARLTTMEIASAVEADAKTSRPVVLFSAQKERQAWIDYVTGIGSVGSLYWDNPNGIREEAEILATYDEGAARRIAQARGVQYFVVAPEGGSVIAYHYMWQGNRNAPQIRQTLAYRLAAPHPTAPSWLQLLPCATPGIVREDIRIYRVL